MTPCDGRPELWTSDAPANRRAAAEVCLTECAARSACARAALEPTPATWGVWAGVDLSLHTGSGRTRSNRIRMLRTIATLQETA